MKKNIRKRFEINLFTHYASVTLRTTKESGFTFEVIVRDGTSTRSFLFHDSSYANEKFEREVRKLES